MAKIEKIKKGTATIYPATIPQAVIDPTSGKSARAELDEKAKHGYESNPKTLKSVDDAKADHGYESNPKTLKAVDDAKADHGYESNPKTLKAVDDAKVDKSSIVGETGQGETTVMHQKAVTDELALKAAHGYASNPKTLKQVDDDKAAHGYIGAETVKTLKEVETLKASHGYESNPKTLKEVDDNLAQLAGDVESTIEMPIAHALSQLKEEVDSLRMLIEEGRINKLQIETLDVISEIRINGSPLIYVRDSAPSFSPDQVPQFYIDTSAGRLYAAKGTGSANDWF